LAVLLIWITMRACQAARAREIPVHRQWMLRSYALIFAAVTLRIELPLLVMAFGDFTPAYRVVSWLCWVPNLLWAEWYIRRTAHAPVPDAQTLRVA
jgi:predicted permease